MKKKFFSLTLILIGSGMWWVLANTARFSIKNWDAKFDSVLRGSLNDLGLTNQDLIASVHEIKKDKGGEWITHHLTVRMPDEKKRADLKAALEGTGARVEETHEGKEAVMLVKRGNRVYQKIHFVNS